MVNPLCQRKGPSGDRYVTVGAKVTPGELNELDLIKVSKNFASRSDVIREAIRSFLKKNGFQSAGTVPALDETAAVEGKGRFKRSWLHKRGQPSINPSPGGGPASNIGMTAKRSETRNTRAATTPGRGEYEQ